MYKRDELLKAYNFPVVAFTVFFVTSFYPILQIALLYLNGFIYSLFALHSEKLFYFGNALLLILSVTLATLSNREWKCNMYSLSFVFFALPLARMAGDATAEYFHVTHYSLFIDPFLIGAGLFVIAFLRVKLLAQKSIYTD